MARASKTGVRGLYTDTSGQLWIDLRWRDPKTGNRERYRERVPPNVPKAAAKRRAQEILSSALAGNFDPKRKPPRKLRAALDAYLDWLATERPKSVGHRRIHATALVASLGDVALDALTPLMVERFKRERRESSAPATINRHLATLKHFVRKAREWAWVPAEAADGVRAVRLLREPPGRVRYLSGDEEQQLFATLPPELRALALAADLSGMRRSEVAGLRWAQVDLANRAITLTRTKSNRVRRIPVHDALAALLEAVPRGPGSDAWVFPLPTLPAGARRIVRSEEERRRQYVSKAFARAASAAGIADLHFHDLRHDFATRLRRAGAGIDAIAKLLGHSTLSMATRYAHLDDPTLRDAVRGLVPPANAASTPAPVVRLADHGGGTR